MCGFDKIKKEISITYIYDRPEILFS